MGIFGSRQEALLLIVASLILFNGLLVVSLAHGVIDNRVFGGAGVLIFSGFLVHALVRRINPAGDPFFFPIAFMLASLGLTMIYRLKPQLYFAQLVWVGIGFFVFLLGCWYFRNMEKLSGYRYIFGVFGIGLLLTAVLFGVEIGGHKSWIVMGPVRFQPSEFAKIFVVLFLAGYLNENKELLRFATRKYGFFEIPEPRFLAPLLLLWFLTTAMYIFQRDLGSALLYFGTVVIMAYMGSGKTSFLTVGTFLFLLGSVISYKFYGHVQTRVDIWIDPWRDPSGGAYQIVQSLFALGSGGLLGSGLTYGFPELIPEVHTDFIFAAIGEEMGFAGAAGTLLIYLFLVYRAFKAALAAQSSYQMLVAGGLATVFSLQVFLIVGGVIKFFPLTGIPLPWVSYGGSSIVSNFIMLSMLFAISGRRPEHG